MSLKQKESITYLRFKDGKFFKSTDKEFTTPYTELEGKIVGIGLRVEKFKDKSLEKLILTIDAGDEICSLGFPIDSSYASKFLSFLKNADLSKTMSLIPSLKKEGDKEIRTIFIKQDDEFLKSAYPKGNTEVPQMKKLKSGKWVKDEFVEFFRDLVLNEFAPLVAKNKQGYKAEEVPDDVEVPDMDEEEEGEEEENKQKLPF